VLGVTATGQDRTTLPQSLAALPPCVSKVPSDELAPSYYFLTMRRVHAECSVSNAGAVEDEHAACFHDRGQCWYDPCLETSMLQGSWMKMHSGATAQVATGNSLEADALHWSESESAKEDRPGAWSG
jgi:hypothetical protein